jgi:hypothetical protein
MFSNAPTTRPDFADTRAGVTETARARPTYSRLEAADAADLLAGADAADLHLLRLVGCAALATLLLALATGLSL